MASNREGRALFKDLAAKKPLAPIYLIYGEESFLVEEAIRAVVRAALPADADSFSHQVYTGGEVSCDVVRQSLETLSLFATEKVIHLRNISVVPASELEALDTYVDRPAANTVLIMSGTQADMRKRFFKKIKASKRCRVVPFKKLYRNELAPWVERRARLKGLEGIDYELAEMIAEWTGPALSEMDSALEKLALFVGTKGGRVTAAVLRQVLDDTRVRTVFELTRHLGGRQLADSMDAMQRLMRRGDSGVGMISLIARHFRIVWRLREGQRLGLKGRQLAGHAGCPPMFVDEYRGDSRRFDETRLSAVFRSIHDADRTLKSTSLRPSVVLSKLIMAICLD